MRNTAASLFPVQRERFRTRPETFRPTTVADLEKEPFERAGHFGSRGPGGLFVKDDDFREPQFKSGQEPGMLGRE